MDPQVAYDRWYDIMMERYEHFKHDATTTVLESQSSLDAVKDNLSEEMYFQFQLAISNFEKTYGNTKKI